MNQLDQQYQRMIDGINAMESRYGELVTYRAARNCLAIDLPLALVRKANGKGVDADIALQTLAGLIVPQVELTPVNVLKSALGSKYTGERADCLVLARMAVQKLEEPPTIEHCPECGSEMTPVDESNLDGVWVCDECGFNDPNR